MLTVVMSTYFPSLESRRIEYAMRCIDAWKELTNIPILLADDGSDEEAIRSLGNFIKHREHVSFVSGRHNGIGASLNRALALIDGSWLYTTDDWLLTAALDAQIALAEYLINTYEYEVVRLGPIHPNIRCMSKFDANIGWWLDLYSKDGFAFATRPFVATKQFYERIGPFVEGQNSYVVEKDYSDRVNNAGLVKLACTPDIVGPWEHIGTEEVGYLEVVS